MRKGPVAPEVREYSAIPYPFTFTYAYTAIVSRHGAGQVLVNAYGNGNVNEKKAGNAWNPDHG